MSKSELMRESYDSTAEFYNERYQAIQFQKYSLSLPEILNIREKGGFFELNFPELMLDYGGGSMLLLKFLIYSKRYIEDKNYIIPPNEEIIIHLENFAQELFDKISQCFNIKLNSSPIKLNIPRMINCDVSFKMLIQGIHQIEELNKELGPELRNALSFSFESVACDGEYLPFRNGVFSTVSAYTVLQNLEHPLSGLSEIDRISKEYSNLIFSVLRKIDPKVYDSILNKIDEIYDNGQDITSDENIEHLGAKYDKILHCLENQANYSCESFNKDKLLKIEDFIHIAYRKTM